MGEVEEGGRGRESGEAEGVREREGAISFYKLFCPVDKLSDAKT